MVAPPLLSILRGKPLANGWHMETGRGCSKPPRDLWAVHPTQQFLTAFLLTLALPFIISPLNPVQWSWFRGWTNSFLTVPLPPAHLPAPVPVPLYSPCSSHVKILRHKSIQQWGLLLFLPLTSLLPTPLFNVVFKIYVYIYIYIYIFTFN